MHKYLVILALALAGLPAAANAQTPQSRFDIYMETCKYRAAQTRRQIALGDWTRESVKQQLDDMPQGSWDAMLVACRTKESKRQVPPPAPQAAIVERPAGEPQRFFKRPPGAPMGEFYRCNPQTFMPDATSSKICGPVKSRRSDI
jgi:hypothetical protein